MNTTQELIRRSRNGDMAAREALVRDNAGLIWSVSKRFLGRGVEADDLYQLGCVGFLKAIDGFDLQYGTQFSTYAVPKIAGEIRRFIRDDGSVKVSRGIKERATAIKSMRSRLMHNLGREPTIAEISEHTGFTIEEIAIAETATAGVESIQQENGEEGFTLETVLTDLHSEEKMLEALALKQAIERLSEREAVVIKLRYYHAMTQEQVSRVLSVSQVQVSRIEKKALIKMREFMK